MNIPPLCIIQARFNSTRLPGKMLLKLGGETLIARAWRIACEAFGKHNCVVAIPAGDEAGPLGDELRRVEAKVVAWDGDENDVLGRFYACAHLYRWHPDSVILRYTPDDWQKQSHLVKDVAGGRRLPVELGGEAFTLSQLDDTHLSQSYGGGHNRREHITHVLFDVPAPPAPEGIFSIDTEADYRRACALLAAGHP